MNDIKMRAWDKGNKIMHYNFQFIASGNEGNDWICFCSDKEPLKTSPQGIVFNNPYFRQQFQIMLATNLFDGNGVPIYFGDIINIESKLCSTKMIVKTPSDVLFLEEINKVFKKGEGIYVYGNIYEHNAEIEDFK